MKQFLILVIVCFLFSGCSPPEFGTTSEGQQANKARQALADSGYTVSNWELTGYVLMKSGPKYYIFSHRETDERIEIPVNQDKR